VARFADVLVAARSSRHSAPGGTTSNMLVSRVHESNARRRNPRVLAKYRLRRGGRRHSLGAGSRR
jgi:hypothetical protein